jgi:hypothetical protein
MKGDLQELRWVGGYGLHSSGGRAVVNKPVDLRFP